MLARVRRTPAWFKTLPDRLRRTPRRDRPLLLLSSAWCRLAPSVRFDGSSITDATGSRFELETPSSRALASLLVEGVSVAGLAAHLVSMGATEDQAATDARKFLGQLDRHRLTSISQSSVSALFYRLKFSVLWVIAVALLADTEALAYRYPSEIYAPSLGSIPRASWHAHGVNFVTGLLVTTASVTFVAWDSGLLKYSRPQYLASLLISSAFFVGLMMTSIVHELGHYVAAHATKSRILAVYARTGAAGLIYESQPRRVLRILALSGAFSSLAVISVLFALTFLIPEWPGMESVAVLLRIVLVLFALLQIKELLPINQDGRLLWGRAQSTSTE